MYVIKDTAVMADMEEASKEKPTSDVCEKTFTHKSILSQHGISHPGDKHFSGIVFRQKHYFLQHRSHTHNMHKRLFSCGVCKQTFKTIPNLNKHIKVHNVDKTFSCDVCHKSFKTKHNLNRHMQIHNCYRLYSCEVCSKTFKRTDSLSRHMMIHTGTADRCFSCNVCSKTFTTKHDLKRHTQIHIGHRLYPCEVCSKTFKRTDTLSTHMRLHTGDRRCFSCHLCSRTCTTRFGLSEHIKVHTGYMPFSCDMCQKYFKRRKQLKRHNQKLHPREVCENAPRGTSELSQTSSNHNEEPNVHNDFFTSQMDLATHISTDRSENSLKTCKGNIFYCNACEKSFWLKSDLTTHMDIHMDCEKFTCRICQKSFIMQGSLIQHMELHTSEKEICQEDEKNLSCFVCSEKYSLCWFLVDDHAGIGLCDQCEQSFVVCSLCDKDVSISELRTHIGSHIGDL